MATMPLIFQYGSNCDEERLNSADRLGGDAKNPRRARTVENFEIAFNKRSGKEPNVRAAADLVKPRKGGCRIWGVLYEVSRAGFKKLKNIEGQSYRPQRISVVDATGATVKATTFRVRRDARQCRLHTTGEYVRHIVNGLRAHDIPEDYIQHVIDIALDTNRESADHAAQESRNIESLRTPGQP